jgi:hypothetical protein
MREEQALAFAPKGFLGHLRRWGLAWLAAAVAIGLGFVGVRRATLLSAKTRKLTSAPPAA